MKTNRQNTPIPTLPNFKSTILSVVLVVALALLTTAEFSVDPVPRWAYGSYASTLPCGNTQCGYGLIRRDPSACTDVNPNSDTYGEVLENSACITARGVAQDVQECFFTPSEEAPLCGGGAEGERAQEYGYKCVYNTKYADVFAVPSNATDYMLCKENSAMRGVAALSGVLVGVVVLAAVGGLF